MICFSFSNRTDELPIVSLKVNGVDYSFLIDTGATCSSISAKFYEGPITNRTMRWGFRDWHYLSRDTCH